MPSGVYFAKEHLTDSVIRAAPMSSASSNQLARTHTINHRSGTQGFKGQASQEEHLGVVQDTINFVDKTFSQCVKRNGHGTGTDGRSRSSLVSRHQGAGGMCLLTHKIPFHKPIMATRFPMGPTGGMTSTLLTQHNPVITPN